MAKLEKIRVLTFEKKSRIGVLAEIASILAVSGVNIEGFCAYEKGTRGVFILAVDDPSKAKKALISKKVKVKVDKALSIKAPNKPGRLAQITQKIAEKGVNIIYAFATTSGKGQSSIIIKSTNDTKVLKALS